MTFGIVLVWSMFLGREDRTVGVAFARNSGRDVSTLNEKRQENQRFTLNTLIGMAMII